MKKKGPQEGPEVGMRKIEWPSRVWEQVEGGWASRPVTDEDRERRRDIEANWGSPVTGASSDD